MDDYKYLGIVNWAKEVIREKNLSAGDKFFSETEFVRHSQCEPANSKACPCLYGKTGNPEPQAGKRFVHPEP